MHRAESLIKLKKGKKKKRLWGKRDKGPIRAVMVDGQTKHFERNCSHQGYTTKSRHILEKNWNVLRGVCRREIITIKKRFMARK